MTSASVCRRCGLVAGLLFPLPLLGTADVVMPRNAAVMTAEAEDSLPMRVVEVPATTEGRWLALFMSGIVALMAAAELALPLFAGQMVDAMAAPARPRNSAVHDALVALAAVLSWKYQAIHLWMTGGA